MDLFAFLFIVLALAVIGLVSATVATVRVMRLKSASSVPGLDVTRARRRSIALAAGSAILFVLATSLFFYIWISCVGEC
jgi:hypothetical protein